MRRRGSPPPAELGGVGRACAAHDREHGHDRSARTPTAPRPSATAPGAQLQAALTKAFKKAGPEVGAVVYDLTAKQTLFALNPNTGRPPASVEKLYTTVALLSQLGPDARLTTTVRGDGHLGPGGVWHGNLYLVGGGDPTFGDGGFNRVWEQGYGPTANDLVDQLVHKGIKRVTGWVIGDAAMFDDLRAGPATGYAPDVPTSVGSCPRSPTTTDRRSRSSTRVRSPPRSSS